MCKKCGAENLIRLPGGFRLSKWPTRKRYQGFAALVIIFVIVWSVILSHPQSRALLAGNTGRITLGKSPTPIIASAATVTITPKSQMVSNTFHIPGVGETPGEQQVQARMLSKTTQTGSQTVNATGQGTTPGTHATGTLLFLGAVDSSFTVDAGTILSCNEIEMCSGQVASLHVIVDQTVTISGLQSDVPGVPAHVQEVGAIGNFNSMQGFCCFFYQNQYMNVNNDSAFTGGTNPQTYTFVQQSDIDNAANSLITANRPDAQQILQGQVQQNERFADTPQCTPNKSANPPANTRASTVTVSVNFTCTGEVYDYDGALSLAEQLLTNQAASNPGMNYVLVGQIVTTWQRTTFDGQTVTITVAARGIRVYQMSDEQKQRWASSLSGERLQEAQTLLTADPGIDRVDIELVKANAQVLPTSPGKITVIVQIVRGFSLPPVQILQ